MIMRAYALPVFFKRYVVMKTFNLMSNVGKVKYLVNFWNGIKKHADGSAFFDVATFTNKRKRDSFVRSLKKEGYTEKGFH
ncbi:MAG: hypothetical protein CBC55_02520 [Gammaproteobacteria bacterium TMED95]|nr:MAG: hypothetical protein CBC55_02520 [Gammaproteobacteria bacterium TMED95]|tara:strand:+ start:3075 stop:3314 length:240 start_codon:yes stop_codon:yes gene_type:complete